MVTVIAFPPGNQEIVGLVHTILGNCFDRDMLPLKIEDKPYLGLASCLNIDIVALERLARKEKCTIEIKSASIDGTAIQINVMLITK